MNFNNAKPHIFVLLIFIAISFIYFSPVLEGKKLDQHDIKTYKGMSKEIKDFRENTGEEALWTNSMFSGMPAYQISVKTGFANLTEKSKTVQSRKAVGCCLLLSNTEQIWY